MMPKGEVTAGWNAKPNDHHVAGFCGHDVEHERWNRLSKSALVCKLASYLEDLQCTPQCYFVDLDSMAIQFEPMNCLGFSTWAFIGIVLRISWCMTICGVLVCTPYRSKDSEALFKSRSEPVQVHDGLVASVPNDLTQTFSSGPRRA